MAPPPPPPLAPKHNSLLNSKLEEDTQFVFLLINPNIFSLVLFTACVLARVINNNVVESLNSTLDTLQLSMSIGSDDDDDDDDDGD
ncbi:hypothetical protein L195_g013625 [Trifolium pratense]|uniref:Transmembrane protein n=1 Tax=Trifolium pratense TaxID=57577 RepID=A0A2K3PNM5_TRIPR|nr:hypothetical protein L195_g013625 [Trifolium pratense]